MIYLLVLLLGIFAIDENPYAKRIKAIKQVEAFSFGEYQYYKMYWDTSIRFYGEFAKIHGCFVILVLNKVPSPGESQYISVHIGKSDDLNNTVVSRFLVANTKYSIDDKHHTQTLIKFIPCSPHQVDSIILYLQELYKDDTVVL